MSTLQHQDDIKDNANLINNEWLCDNKQKVVDKMCDPYTSHALIHGFVRMKIGKHPMKDIMDILFEYCFQQSEEWETKYKGDNIVIDANNSNLITYDYHDAECETILLRNVITDDITKWKFKCNFPETHWSLIGVHKVKFYDTQPRNFDWNDTLSNGYSWYPAQGRLQDRMSPNRAAEKYGGICDGCAVPYFSYGRYGSYAGTIEGQKEDCIIEMTLDLIQGTLAYTINGYDLGTAFHYVQGNAYKGAVTFQKKGSVELLSFEHQKWPADMIGFDPFEHSDNEIEEITVSAL